MQKYNITCPTSLRFACEAKTGIDTALEHIQSACTALDRAKGTALSADDALAQFEDIIVSLEMERDDLKQEIDEAEEWAA